MSSSTAGRSSSTRPEAELPELVAWNYPCPSKVRCLLHSRPVPSSLARLANLFVSDRVSDRGAS
jgi:hypothetical protein